jgi:hypothetical protein
MYFPDNFAGLMALSERVHGVVMRWRTAIGRKLRRPAEHSLRPRRNGGVSALCQSVPGRTRRYRYSCTGPQCPRSRPAG